MAEYLKMTGERKLFGLAAIALVLMGAAVMHLTASLPITIRDLGMAFAGGSFASAWIAFEHWRTGDLINTNSDRRDLIE